MIFTASKSSPTAALILGAVLALGGTPCLAGPGPMQVEEPEAQAVQPPIQPDRDKQGWQSRKNATLTRSQKAALKARQDTMRDMMALIQQKRRAIREARPEDRQALAQELHNIILEQAQRAERTRERTEGRNDAQPAAESIPNANARTQESALDPKDRGMDRKAERLELQESHRQMIEQKQRQAENKAGSGGRKED